MMYSSMPVQNWRHTRKVYIQILIESSQLSLKFGHSHENSSSSMNPMHSPLLPHMLVALKCGYNLTSVWGLQLKCTCWGWGVRILMWLIHYSTGSTGLINNWTLTEGGICGHATVDERFSMSLRARKTCNCIRYHLKAFVHVWYIYRHIDSDTNVDIFHTRCTSWLWDVRTPHFDSLTLLEVGKRIHSLRPHSQLLSVRHISRLPEDITLYRQRLEEGYDLPD